MDVLTLSSKVDSLSRTPYEIARELVSQRFQRFKCNFGSELMDGSLLRLGIPGLIGGIFLLWGPSMGKLPSVRSYTSSSSFGSFLMFLFREELQHLFDAKIDEVHTLLDEQIRSLQSTYPQEQIVLLSGGFGSSPYVRKRLKERYQRGILPSLVEILTVDEPQLAVVQGQTLNRIQQIKLGVSAFDSLCSRVSYGVICDQLYDPSRHASEPVRYDDETGKSTRWDRSTGLLCRGIQRIPMKDLSPGYGPTLGGPDSHVNATSTQVPQSMAHSGATLICNIEVDMASVDRKPQNHRWYHRNPAHFLATFTIKMVVGPNDLEFELWNKSGGRIRSQNKDPIAIKWNPTVEKMDETMRGPRELFADDKPRRRYC
ncbi:hypothetical protein EYZ11_000578 [Aspergillus tanneri]|uniref:Uncharacterized protein n=1 Tax=Aspergillus tanneri TaxID=1220188 RepID=A0A4S3JWW5_9EURO|nr:hypothetical protein EYZ11_000578 [Aspergillus tanneri]